MDAAIEPKVQRRKTFRVRNFLSTLGPGLITGASDDDPSGIGTYSQAGAQLGFGIGWTMLLSYPLMAAIQEISGRIGRVTGHGIAGNVCRNFGAAWVWSLVGLLFVANTINIAADLGAMADALKLLIGGPGIAYVVLFGTLSVLAQIFFNYDRYVSVLKWLTLSLFAYVIALAVVKVPWEEALKGVLIPRVSWDAAFLTTLVAILGTTISPYLFVWQSSQEAEEQRIDADKKPLKKDSSDAPEEFRRIRLDTMIGMAFSNLIALSIIVTTAATLHAQGKTDIESSAQAAEALKPIAGPFAELIFALGIVGTGLLAIPVLAGSTAYAIGEGRRWKVGLSRKPKEAIAFYSVLALSGFCGIGLNFTPIDPIKALYWSAVVNGVLAAPVMVLLMVLVRRPKVMGKLVVTGPLYWLGWAATAAMALCIVGMVATMFMGSSS
ncbi:MULTISPECIES: NRAMP family divalent metal transporter [Bradyrhizobium]|jgi:NRAMP (natural resistance-associated macrophage protein)-like metal ion transporter|nr:MULTISPECIES: divalent metal cation transporter [Bradyrhizobium]AND92894.1 iron transporter [Bradyrhizobium diazoefficiens USDA 110]MBR1001145.1 divalent metal cation transporter [Bradyrhizobium liaoningense]MCG2643120.1 divalent metal cation transporter [Bradyrhizobium zhengyangense]MCG2671713.1 divalent metal cation transporter [Bradyrhizobium zhengyangense]MCP1747160.1 NRAMP (natural resistance-associated macrophage protein)-like metal ion transporter [Bradyrhizobium japonicum]